jgi:hypothetical protein
LKVTRKGLSTEFSTGRKPAKLLGSGQALSFDAAQADEEGLFDPEFKQKATIYVFDHKPAVFRKGSKE